MFANHEIDFGLETDSAGTVRLLGGYDKERVFYTAMYLRLAIRRVPVTIVVVKNQ